MAGLSRLVTAEAGIVDLPEVKVLEILVIVGEISCDKNA